MKILHGGAAVIEASDRRETEGTRSYRVPSARAMGARDITQSISLYSEGLSPARRRATGEEALYVVGGEGNCFIDGFRYGLHAGTALYVPPGSLCQVESAGALEIVSVCCPDDDSETSEKTIRREPSD